MEADNLYISIYMTLILFPLRPIARYITSSQAVLRSRLTEKPIISSNR